MLYCLHVLLKSTASTLLFDNFYLAAKDKVLCSFGTVFGRHWLHKSVDNRLMRQVISLTVCLLSSGISMFGDQLGAYATVWRFQWYGLKLMNHITRYTGKKLIFSTLLICRQYLSNVFCIQQVIVSITDLLCINILPLYYRGYLLYCIVLQRLCNSRVMFQSDTVQFCFRPDRYTQAKRVIQEWISTLL